jgi:xylose dehydrogenase (NAD/NADP)
MSVIRWGILGTAHIAEKALVPAIHAAQGAELVAVASRSLEKAQAYAERNQIRKAYGSYEELLADPDVDAVYIPLPNHLHAEWTIKAAEAGKHVLCEKPAALNADEARRMIAACQAHGVVFMEAFMYSLHPQWARVRELLDGGVIGELELISANFSFHLDNPVDIRWYPIGGGALYDVGCYCVHVTRTFAGDELPTEVRALADLDEHGVDRSVVALLRFPGGVLAHLDCSFVAADRQRVELAGTKGSLVVTWPFRPDKGDPAIHVRTRDGERVERFDKGEIYRLEVEHFGECVRTGATPQQTPEQTIRNMEILDAIYRAVGRDTAAPAEA